jgi:hypothetical protein
MKSVRYKDERNVQKLYKIYFRHDYFGRNDSYLKGIFLRNITVIFGKLKVNIFFAIFGKLKIIIFK